MDTISLFIQTEEVLLKWQVTKPTWSCVSGDFINLMSVWGGGGSECCCCFDKSLAIIRWSRTYYLSLLWVWCKLMLLSVKRLLCSRKPLVIFILCFYYVLSHSLYLLISNSLLLSLSPPLSDYIRLWPHPFCTLSISNSAHFALSLTSPR